MENTVYGLDGSPSRKASKRHRRNAIKAGSRIHFALFLYISLASFIISVIAAALYLTYTPEQADEILNNPYVLWGLQVLCMYVISFPIYLLCTRGLPRPTYRKKKLNPGEFTATFFISTAVMIFGSLIASLISFIISIATGYVPESTLDVAITGTPLWIIILVVVIIGPIFEELIFRKILLDRLSIYGDRLAIMVSAISFGLFHGNIEQFIYATGLGIVLGYLYTRTRNVKYPILMHMILNFFGTVPSAILMQRMERLNEIYENLGEEEMLSGADAIFEMQVGLESLSVTAIQYGFAIAGLVLFIVLTAKRAYKFPNERSVDLPAYTKFRTVFFNIGYIFFLAYSLFTIALNTFPALSEFLKNYLTGLV